MGETIINFFEKVNTLVYKKVPYQVYVGLALFSLLAVGQLVYDYNTQPTDLTDWSKIKLAELNPSMNNYEGLYNLGLIPNSKELPATKADKIIGASETKLLVESPFGWTYVRSR
jgi:hypothetical protein